MIDFINTVPEGSSTKIGCVLEAEKEVICDMYNWKKGDQRLKAIKLVNSILNNLGMLDSMECISSGYGGAAPEGEQEPEPWPEVALVPLAVPQRDIEKEKSPVKAKAMPSPKKGKAVTKAEALETPRKAWQETLDKLSAWGWENAKGWLSMYSSLFCFITAFLPAVGLNLLLGAGMCCVLLGLLFPYEIGDVLSSTFWMLPEFGKAWAMQFWQGLRQRKQAAECPPCQFSHGPYNFTEASWQTGQQSGTAQQDAGTTNVSPQVTYVYSHPPTPPDNQIWLTMATTLFGLFVIKKWGA